MVTKSSLNWPAWVQMQWKSQKLATAIVFIIFYRNPHRTPWLYIPETKACSIVPAEAVSYLTAV